MGKRRKKQEISIGTAVMLLVFGLILGSIFVFGSQYWGEPIQREDAIEISATYEAYEINPGKIRKHHIKQIEITLADHSSVYIDGACVSEKVKDELKALPEGEKVDMLVHPNSDTVWELKHGNKTILSFEESQKDIKNENIGFIILGIFMYFCAVIGFGSLLMRGVKARKNNKRSKRK